MTMYQNVRSLTTRRLCPLFRPCSSQVRSLSFTSPLTQSHDPLRVLFCGADKFSIYSLRVLNGLRLEHPEKVASIDVVCRTDKRVGRGLKQIQAVPIKKVAAEELDLNVHQIDTFTGWGPPRPHGEAINLIVAVSFGRLVPPRILDAAKYGGLNVHPSMLPDLRGSAPLHHTLLNRLERTGVTLQTLHPKHFDQGLIVDQTPQPGLLIPDLEHATPESLLDFVGPLGAEMLKASIRNGTFTESRPGPDTALRHAPKITPSDRRIDWDRWSADEIVLRDRVLGRLWDERKLNTDNASSKRSDNKLRTIYHGFTKYNGDLQELLQDCSEKEVEALCEHSARLSNGSALVGHEFPKLDRILLKCCDGSYVSPRELTPEGGRRMQAQEIYNNRGFGVCIPKSIEDGSLNGHSKI